MLKKKWLSSLSRFLFLSDLPYWTAAVLVGLFAVLYARMFQSVEHLSQKIFEHSGVWFLLVSPLCFVFATLLVVFLAPYARGSGIPQVMASIDRLEKHNQEEKVEEYLGLKVSFIKILSSLFCVLGGGAIGREGPTIQIAASIFYWMDKKFEKITHYKLNHEYWLVAGGASGIAAAFNTPLGGIVYAIEELSTSHFHRFKSSLIAAVIIAGFSAQWVSGPYLYLGFPKIFPVTVSVIFWAILVGAFVGYLGAMFGKILFQLSSKVRLFTKGSWKKAAVVSLVMGFTLAMMALFEPRTLGSGKDTLMMYLFQDPGSVEGSVLFSRYFGPIITYLSGAAGGVFAPSLSIGGTLGHAISIWFSQPQNNLFILMGMIAFLTGVTRTPFTSFILVLEMTDRHSAIFALMLSALVASGISKMLGQKSFYEQVKDQILST